VGHVSATDKVITVDYGTEYVEFSAVQSGGKVMATDQPEQIAVGAAIDGYPIFRLLDTDNDRRISQREARQLPGLLRELDRNGDGAIVEAELPLAVRVAVSRGTLVHQWLSQPVAASKARISPKSSAAPDWFASMDTNHDGDLTRDEFAGTRDQFQSLDRDNDGLVSAEEAASTKQE
jgi:Ca2+-binding EF-hand superfamily protein